MPERPSLNCWDMLYLLCFLNMGLRFSYYPRIWQIVAIWFSFLNDHLIRLVLLTFFSALLLLVHLAPFSLCFNTSDVSNLFNSPKHFMFVKSCFKLAICFVSPCVQKTLVNSIPHMFTLTIWKHQFDRIPSRLWNLWLVMRFVWC